jgi:hypothetical protein
MGVSRDWAEAARFLKLSAAHADAAPAQCLLGCLYDEGEGVVQDGLLHSDGKGVAQDDVEAVRLWQLAAERGHPDGQLLLALHYSKGRGVLQNHAEAARL